MVDILSSYAVKKTLKVNDVLILCISDIISGHEFLLLMNNFETVSFVDCKLVR